MRGTRYAATALSDERSFRRARSSACHRPSTGIIASARGSYACRRRSLDRRSRPASAPRAAPPSTGPRLRKSAMLRPRWNWIELPHMARGSIEVTYPRLSNNYGPPRTQMRNQEFEKQAHSRKLCALTKSQNEFIF